MAAGEGQRDGSRRPSARSAGRPNANERRVTRAAASSRPVPARGVFGLSSTRRAAVLALVVCVVVLSVAVPLRNYLAQRGELHSTLQLQEKLREQVDLLEQRKDQLSDPAQVQAEARNRLRYVRPGERPYVVQLPTPTPAGPLTETPRSPTAGPWYEELWRSVAGGQP